MSHLLRVEGVGKRFGGVRALERITFDLPEGQILGLIGPNGAGKTTLFNAINGVVPPDSGRIIFLGKDVTRTNPARLARMGLARTHQIVRPLAGLTVRENVMVGACFGSECQPLGAAARTADEVLGFVGLAARAGQPAGNLNIAQKKRLELARALASRPRLLLLDEVLAGLNPAEVDRMVGVVGEIRAGGVTVIMIEHVMRAVMRVCDRILVLENGARIADGPPAAIAANPQVIAAYLGIPEMIEQIPEDDGHP